jgi:hypothetical protein
LELPDSEVYCIAAIRPDITYIPMAHGFVYLAAVMDWFARRILSWARCWRFVGIPTGRKLRGGFVELVSSITSFHARTTKLIFKRYSVASERIESSIGDQYCAKVGEVRAPLSILLPE